MDYNDICGLLHQDLQLRLEKLTYVEELRSPFHLLLPTLSDESCDDFITVSLSNLEHIFK